MIDAHKIIESDFIRLLIISGKKDINNLEVAFQNLNPEDLRIEYYKNIYKAIRKFYQNPELWKILDLVVKLPDKIVISVDDGDTTREKERIKETLKNTIKTIFYRKYMDEREEIRHKIQSRNLSEQELMDIIKKFDELCSNPPTLNL